MYRSLLILSFIVAQNVAAPNCGSSSSSSSGSTQNVQPIIVNSGPNNDYFNGAFTSVTICMPGQASNCQTINGILVDTGSSGLRILSSALALSLPQQTSNGAPVVECGEFADGFTWGPVQMADIKLAGEQASSVPVQVIGAPGFSTIPSACSNVGTPENTLDSLGANGLLGVGVFRQDCGPGCAVGGPSNPGIYFTCSTSGCQPAIVPLAQQLQNPVWLFSSDNNGVVIQLPAVPAAGELSASGNMIMGIGTQSNNALGGAKVFTTDLVGNFTTVFNGQSYSSSYIDSGSNGYYFLDSATTGLAICTQSSDFYCPPAARALSATTRGVNGTTATANFTIAGADQFFSSPFSVFGQIGGPNPGSFDWGLPFFYGRGVFTAIEGQSTPGGQGPYYAY